MMEMEWSGVQADAVIVSNLNDYSTAWLNRAILQTGKTHVRGSIGEHVRVIASMSLSTMQCVRRCCGGDIKVYAPPQAITLLEDA